ncbi:MAG: flagellar hook-length control protein FliK [Rhodocyclales bacterium]|nr:flagellar hook-length control protein FliK [Rhodocyclales bacterium]
MIPSDLAARLRMLTEASFFDSEPPVQGTAKVREVQARLPQLIPGQQFTATLLRGLPDGTYQAVVAGRNYTLALNQSAKAGDTLELVVTKSTPGTVYAQAVPVPVPSGPADPARASLSPTGRLISFLLTGQPEPQPALLAAGKPLLSAPPAGNGADLAPMLRQALAQTGLFYESHQLQWLSGKLDTANLLKEPQGQQPSARPQPTLSHPAGAAPSNAPPADTQGVAARVTLNTLALTGENTLVRTAEGQAAKYLEVGQSLTTARPYTPAERVAADGMAKDTAGAAPQRVANAPPGTSATGQSNAPASSAAPATSAPAARGAENLAGQPAPDTAQPRPPTVPDRLVPLVHQQLNAMATQTYVWHGQAWPGQPIEWEIEDPQHEERAPGDEPENTWNTTLRLTLPQLGGVEARMHLTPAGLALRLVADTPDTVAALDAARDRLDSALSAANVPLTGFVVESGNGR